MILQIEWFGDDDVGTLSPLLRAARLRVRYSCEGNNLLLLLHNAVYSRGCFRGYLPTQI